MDAFGYGFPREAQLIPSGEVIIAGFVDAPTKREPFHAILLTIVVRPLARPVHVIPSGLVAMQFPPVPPAIHRLFANVTVYPVLVNVVAPIPNQVIPSEDLAIVFVPSLTAIHREPFQKAALHLPFKGLVLVVQVTKFGEVLIWPDRPNAIHKPFPNAMEQVGNPIEETVIQFLPSDEYVIPAVLVPTHKLFMYVTVLFDEAGNVPRIQFIPSNDEKDKFVPLSQVRYLTLFV